MRITGIHAQRRHTARANLHIDEEFYCGVAWDVAQSMGLRVGAEVSAGTLHELRLNDECWRAKQAALSLLATRARARRELMDRLARKGFEPRAVEHALQEMDRLGLMDDRAFAESWVRDRLRARPRGSRALIAELGRKGVAADVARTAVADVMGARDTSDAALCVAAAEKWLDTKGAHATRDIETRRRVERRLAGFLARRGFPASDIRLAMRRLSAT